jgi:hypothetical protein
MVAEPETLLTQDELDAAISADESSDEPVNDSK